jgi:hypothetical protein
MLLRSPGRGGSVCRSSWISDLCLCLSIAPSLPPLLHLSLFASLCMLASFPCHKAFLYIAAGKIAISPHSMILSAQDPGRKGSVCLSVTVCLCLHFLLLAFILSDVMVFAHPWTNYCTQGSNNLIGQIPIRSLSWGCEGMCECLQAHDKVERASVPDMQEQAILLFAAFTVVVPQVRM